VVTPYYNRPTQEGLKRHFEFLARQSEFPIVLYNVPSRTGVNLLPETTLELFRNCEEIVGIKEANEQYSQWLLLASQMDHSKKSLFAGVDDGFTAVMALGGSGIISASANVVPEHFVKMYQLATEGKVVEAFGIQKRLEKFVRAMFIETNPAPIKYALSVTRRLPSNLRLPLVSVL
jgi:4-hydroxy-tetrahydrodipicolinate synthase